ncbi:MAG TPA: cystathionine beta-synthase [Thermomicrobiaceae bacterium]|nr:cystathionine beta-synthase [Thermomicrobiaceae bacterium]
MIYPNVLSVVGDTPLVRLNSVTRGLRATVVGKMEMLNPGGSVKDRIGFRMLEEAERRGWLKPGGTIVEPTSGNTGVGLAMASAVKGYRCIFVMPDKISAEKVALLRAYGADVVTTPTSVPRESPESYYSVADQLTRDIPGAFQPNQYFNPINPRSHYETTGPEIWRQSEGKVTHFVAGVGTGGTISGTGRYLKEQNPALRVVGADPEGSIFTDPDNVRPYKVEGIGEDFWPGSFDRGVVDEFVQVSDRDSFLTARRVTREEGILIGGSGGTAVWAALQVARREDREDTLVVVLLPDSGRGYLSKLYNDDWMRENGFLSRFGRAARVAALVGNREDPEIPAVVAADVEQTVEEAIGLLRRYRISQMPVVRRVADATDGRVDVHAVVGSIQERGLLDQVFRHPAAIHEKVSTVMDSPFPLVDVKEEVERVFPLLAAGAPAVLVQEQGALVGVLTRADLLEFVAHNGTKG